jgi:hypothetical protein
MERQTGRPTGPVSVKLFELKGEKLQSGLANLSTKNRLRDRFLLKI